MLVILKENVSNLGRIGEVVKVSNGYARNFLLPRKLVVAASETNVAAIEHHKRSLEKKRLAQREIAKAAADKLSAFSCNIPKKVGENDKIFGSVSTTEIAAVLVAAGFDIDKRMIEIETPIRSLGVHSVTVKLEPEVTATVKVWVVKQD